MVPDRLKPIQKLCNALFPKEFPCVSCGGEAPTNALGLCKACMQAVFPNDRACPGCARPLPRDGKCPECREGLSALDGGAAPFVYSGAIRRAVGALKFRSRADLAEAMGRVMAAAMPFEGFDFVVFVPGSERHRRSRGYHPAQLLAEQVARQIQTPMLEGALVRARRGPAQRSLSLAERRENAEKIFSARMLPELRDARILLVDDVTTTGATASCCARRLKEAGARTVYLLAFAATER